MIQTNLKEVKSRIQAACETAGRSSQEVTLIAVSKTKPLEAVQEAIDCGLTVFGENKVQELAMKYDAVESSVTWHFIGHLQRNKVKQLIGKVKLIHSVDSYRLAEQISKESVGKNIVSHILIEVNLAGEESKFGVPPEETEGLIREVSRLPGIIIDGLMTIAPYTDHPESNRIHFKNLRKLLVDINRKNIDNVNMDELSMGMTGDYTVAIEEGATYIRVGTGLFGAR